MDQTPLNEKVLQVQFGQTINIPIIQNPNSRQLDNFLERYKYLRGMIDVDDTNMIWNASAIDHYNVEIKTGTQISIGYYLEMKNGMLHCTWSDYDGGDADITDCDNFISMVKNHAMKYN